MSLFQDDTQILGYGFGIVLRDETYIGSFKSDAFYPSSKPLIYEMLDKVCKKMGRDSKNKLKNPYVIGVPSELIIKSNRRHIPPNISQQIQEIKQKAYLFR